MTARTALLSAGALAAGVMLGYALFHRPAEQADHKVGTARFGPRPLVGQAGSGSPSRGPVREAVSADALCAEIDDLLKELSPGRRKERLYELVHGLDVKDVPAAVTCLLGHRNPEAIAVACQLGRRWARTDPAAAVAYARSLTSSSARDKLVQAALQEWTVADSVAAIKWLDQLQAGKEKDQCRATIFESLAAQDPKTALSLAGSVRAGFLKKLRLQASVLEQWAMADPSAAAAAAEQIRGGKDLPAETWGRIASQWAAVDPNAALAWVTRSTDGAQRVIGLKGVAETWGGIDGQAAAAYFLSRTNSGLNRDERTLAFAATIRVWAARDPIAGMRWAASLEDPANRKDALQMAVAVCAEIDPRTAAPYLQSLAPEDQTRPARQMVDVLFEDDPDSALSFALSLPAGDVQKSSLRGLFNQWASLDRSAALAAMGQLPEGQAREAALTGLLQEWGRTDPTRAGEYLAALPPEQQGPHARELVQQWALTDPAAAGKWLATLPQTESRDDAIAALARSWAVSSFDQAGEYVANLAPGNVQSKALTAILGTSVSNNPERVRQWIAGFPSGPLRDDAVSYVSLVMKRNDPGAAIQWLDTSFGGAYSELERLFFKEWLLADRQAASKWLESRGLSAESKSRLLKP